jgi:uncharacterized membrane protein
MIILHYVSLGIGILGVTIIVWGVLNMFIRLIRFESKKLRHHCAYLEREALRHQLGSYLLLGLEFLIAADIIGTIVHPTLREMAVLASIVGIRTLISYFLDREAAQSPGLSSSSDELPCK